MYKVRISEQGEGFLAGKAPTPRLRLAIIALGQGQLFFTARTTRIAPLPEDNRRGPFDNRKEPG
jgi:hypothetical protein